MVSITKEERELILDIFPYVKIIRTMKQKSKRHNYYVEENPDVKKFLQELRSNKIESVNGGKKEQVEEIDWSKYYKKNKNKYNNPRNNNNYSKGNGKGRGKSNYGNKNKERYDKRDSWN